MEFRHRRTSDLARPADAAWAAATSLMGIESELPLGLRLRTEPPVLTLAELLAVDRAVVATLRLGPVRVVRWTLRIEHLDVAGRSFVEASSDMRPFSAWRHERRVVATGPGSCRVEDTVSGASRLPFAGVAVGWLFAARHRRLRRSGATPRS